MIFFQNFWYSTEYHAYSVWGPHLASFFGFAIKMGKCLQHRAVLDLFEVGLKKAACN